MSQHNPLLGTLEPVSLESIWPHESQNFTPWLAKPENLKILADTLGMDLEPETEEVPVGPFYADIRCKNMADVQWVVIENQIKKTDHTHLGQILTYAAGLGAKTMVWIAAKFTEEHRAVLDWLNENTSNEMALFGLEIELWKIGASPPAPKFNVVCKPNDWSKTIKKQAQGAEGEVTEHKKLQFEFWTEFKAYLEEHTKLRCQSPQYQHWLTLSLGRSGFVLYAITSAWNSVKETWAPEIRVELSLSSPQAKEQFAKLESMKGDLQQKIDLQLTWHNPEQRKSAKIFVRCDADFTNRDQWHKQFGWLATYLQQFREVFGPIVKTL